MTAGLEDFERAFRLRSRADDGLMEQIFGGADALEELRKNDPTLLETARSYFPHLTASTYDRLVREPDVLQVEKDRCEREMAQLAVQNYGAFIGNAKVTQAVREELSSIQKDLDSMAEQLAPVQASIEDFKTKATALSQRRAALRNVKEQQGTLLELLEVPQLIDACIRNQLYDESLELLTTCGNMLQVQAARDTDVSLVTVLQEQIAEQRAGLHAALVAQLRTDIHLPACVRVIGFLRRLQRHSEEELRRLFIDNRGVFLESHKQQVEALRGNRGSVVTAMKNAADLLRTHAYDIGTQYRALFPSDDGPLSAWLGEQIVWLTGLLRAHLLPATAGDVGRDGSGASQRPKVGGTAVAPSARIDAVALSTILRHIMHASSTLRRLGGHFFPSVAAIFEARMEHHVCEMLDLALLTLSAEMGRYDWVPSTALAGGGGGGGADKVNADPATATNNGATAESSGGTGGAGGSSAWLHPQALELTRHRPLAVFCNDVVQMFNELRQCALFGLRVSVVKHTANCMMGAVNMLRSVQSSQVAPTQARSSKAEEILRFAENFAHILLPMVAAHLEVIFGSCSGFDTAAIVAAMEPDLLPPPDPNIGQPSLTADAEADAEKLSADTLDVKDASPAEAPTSTSVQKSDPLDIAAVSTHADTAVAASDVQALPAVAAIAQNPAVAVTAVTDGSASLTADSGFEAAQASSPQ
eukprot:TRINITY_DN73935_c0_g1_i1.p1 TRINITY_DN73935_c0_g1~~TRINITY_DN73935_c0_g1_i1.p1  ORF type:complete len:700 (-),score=134.05 TRINITY_DN73935_c0_g1_i1:47-2146(-)